eukprot:4634272-Pyramimonas_sp.AAC.1
MSCSKRRCSSALRPRTRGLSPHLPASEEWYRINFLAVGGACPWAAGKFIPLRCHCRGINSPAALGQAPPTAK